MNVFNFEKYDFKVLKCIRSDFENRGMRVCWQYSGFSSESSDHKWYVSTQFLPSNDDDVGKIRDLFLVNVHANGNGELQP